MKLSDWAKSQGITYKTAWQWWKQGKLPVKATQTQSGTILVEPSISTIPNIKAWIYVRVSSPDKKDDLERQARRATEFCQEKGWEVVSIVKEIASGLNDSRPKFTRLLQSRPSRIVVEDRYRMTRFGFRYLEILLPMLGCELVVINRDTEEKDELLKDLLAIITSFCNRLYGLHKGKRKAKEIEALL
jgi:putative resolvase